MTPAEKDPRGRTGPGGGDTVLLVDDDPAVHRTVGEMLKRSGYSVLTAGNGAAALDLLGGCVAVDLVIADYRMPGMDGLMLVRRIKERLPNLPVVILTGHGDLESYLCASDLGVIRYINKPVRLRELLQTVQEAIEDGGHGRQVQAKYGGQGGPGPAAA